jgi:arylsulfatase A-like enzyme
VFTADHGEAFGQHGIFSHGGKYYEEESHVPGFVFAPPDAWRDPAVAARLTEIRENRGAFLSNIDLFPTLLDLAQIDPAPVRAQLEGYSAARPLPEDRRYLFSNCSDFRRCPIPFFGFYSRGVKYMFHADSKRWEAFDIMADPRDLHDVAATHMAEIGAAMPWLRQHSTAVRLLDGIW